MRRKNPVPFLRLVGLIEGASFLLLLGVAMPLKYFAGMPTAVKVAGWIHGVLFILFVGALARTMVVAKWPIGRGALVLGAALLPLGPFVIDGRMSGYAAESQERGPGELATDARR